LIFVADIGGSFIKFGRSFAPSHLEECERVPTPTQDWADFVATLKTLLHKYDKESQKQAPLALSIAAMIDPQTGQAFCANIPCVSGHVIEQELSQELGRPVFAANDADCLGLAEAVEGAGKGHSNVFCTIFGTGAGGALIINGQLVQGVGGIMGEWGHGAIANTHVTLAGEGMVEIPLIKCGCGQTGCLDTIGSARGLERIDSHLNGGRRNSHDILAAWQKGEHQAARTVSAWLQLVADALATVINITGSSIVPAGGGLATDTKLMAALDQAVRDRTLAHHAHSLVVPGHFSNNGGLRGAAILARQRLSKK